MPVMWMPNPSPPPPALPPSESSRELRGEQRSACSGRHALRAEPIEEAMRASTAQHPLSAPPPPGETDLFPMRPSRSGAQLRGGAGPYPYPYPCP